LFIGIDDLLMRPWRGLDDLMSLLINKQAHRLPIENPIGNRISCNRSVTEIVVVSSQWSEIDC
jgi:hypothetical protein